MTTTTTTTTVPKTSNIVNPVFDKGVNWYLQDSRLSPNDDPYMQKWLDLYTTQSQKAFDQSTYQLNDQLSGQNLLGTGYYQGQMAAANQNYNDTYEQNLTKYLSDTRNAAIQDRLKALGLITDRDTAQTAARAQVASARASAAPGLAGVRLERQQWLANQPYTDLKSTLDIMNGLNTLGGYTMSGSYIPQTYGGSPWASGIISGIGGGLATYGALNGG